jgi:hypothetical protein
MKLLPWLFLCASCAIATPAAAADYSLNDGRVRFTVPSTWTAVMEKRGEDPQAIAFDVPDAAPRDGGAIASVTVKTRSLAAPTDFAASVQDEMQRAQAQPGYAADTSTTDPARFRYTILRGTLRHAVEDRFVLLGDIAVQVRCQRPLSDAGAPAGAARFDGECADVFASLRGASGASGAP